MIEHLIITEKEKYLVVTCSEGHYITNWDGKDIIKYTSAKAMYCPKTTDLSNYYCLTEEEHAANEEEQKKAIEKEIENKNKNHKLV